MSTARKAPKGTLPTRSEDAIADLSVDFAGTKSVILGGWCFVVSTVLQEGDLLLSPGQCEER